MLLYKAGYKYVDGGVHAQVLDFPAAITCADTLPEARRLLALALLDVAEAAMESGGPIPPPNSTAYDPEWTSKSQFIYISTLVQMSNKYPPA